MVMDCEPLPKRRRTASPPLQQEINHNIKPPQGHSQQEGADDKAYQISLERAFADPRFRSTLAQIFDKYDRKTDRRDEAIDPALCDLSAGDNNLSNNVIEAHPTSAIDNLALNESLPYHLDAPGDQLQNGVDSEKVDYHVDGSADASGPYMAGFEAPAYMPNFSDGMHPGFMQGWYANPFQAAGPNLPPWNGFAGELQIPSSFPTSAGPWMTPNGFTYGQAPWPAPATEAPEGTSSLPQVQSLEPPTLLQEMAATGNVLNIAQDDESTDNCQAPQTYGLGGTRRRPIQPRFSKNGKRLGRPPKPDTIDGVPTSVHKYANDSGAYDGEGEDNGGVDPNQPITPAEFEDGDSDTLWGELEEALRLATKPTSKKRARDGPKLAQNRENSATESDGTLDTDLDAGQAEAMLRKIQKKLIDRAVRRSTETKEPEDSAEGHRRSGRERKPVDFGDQVSWTRVSAERRASYKINMHLRALNVQARREQKKKEKEEAEKAAAEKREEEERQAAAANKPDEPALESGESAAVPATQDAPETLPSTIPDSQDTVTTLPIRTTPQRPQSNHIMRQTIKNHVNSVVHFEEDDDAFSDDEAPAPVPIRKPVFALPKKPVKQANSFLGENYIDTVYALSDDEAPALLDSMKRVSIGEKKKSSSVSTDALPNSSPATGVAASDSTKNANELPDARLRERPPSRDIVAGTSSDSVDMPLPPNMDTTEEQMIPALPTPPAKLTESDEAARPPMPHGGDGDDSGIDIPNEQTPSEQAARAQVTRQPAAVEPTFQDPDILGAADILDSLDVMSETEDMPYSPVISHERAKEGIEENHSPNCVSPVDNAAQMQIFVDEGPAFGRTDVFEMPISSDEEPDIADLQPSDSIRKEPKDTASEHTLTQEHPTEPTPATRPNLIFVQERPADFDTDEDIHSALPPENSYRAPQPRHPLPQQMKSKKKESKQSRSPTPIVAKPKVPSLSASGDRSRLSSSSSSRKPASVSKSNSCRKSFSSSRRSLLSLIDGGEENIESLINRASPAAKTPKLIHAKPAALPTAAAAFACSSPVPSKKPSSSSSHRRPKPLSSSSSSSLLPRPSLGSSFSRSMAHKSSKERKEARDRRRKSSGAAAITSSSSSASTAREKEGACGVEGYTCGRDFCFTCL